MKTMKLIVLLGGLLILAACGTSKKIQEPNMALNQMMEERVFKIDIRSAEPQLTNAMTQIANSGILQPGNTITRIDVTGSGYFIEVQGDSVSANLPYYGERQMGGGYNADSGIKFSGITDNLVIEKNEGKQSYTATFSIDGSSETYFVTTTIGTNLTSTAAIRSSHRNRIRFTGNVRDLEDDGLVSK